jgi:predicted GNAT superfamily acetyltransferase
MPGSLAKKAVRISIPSNLDELRSSNPAQAQELQSTVRAEFLKWFRKGYAATAVVPGKDRMDYILEPGSPK